MELERRAVLEASGFCAVEVVDEMLALLVVRAEEEVVVLDLLDFRIDSAMVEMYSCDDGGRSSCAMSRCVRKSDCVLRCLAAGLKPI